jgi:hypothetical protein
LYSASVVEIGLNWPAAGLGAISMCQRNQHTRSYFERASMVVTDDPSTLQSGRRHCGTSQQGHAAHNRQTYRVDTERGVLLLHRVELGQRHDAGPAATLLA